MIKIATFYIFGQSSLISHLTPVMEMPTGKGFADVVYLPKRNTDKLALVVELKWNKSAQRAIGQIKSRQYTD